MEDKILVTRSLLPPYEEYIEAIKPLWDSHWLTNMGIYHKELEKRLREYLDVPELSLMVNGHMALELCIQAMGLPEGAEVITTPFTFISTTHAIIRNNLKPVFCDIKEADGTIDESKIEALITEKTAAILPVHVYGHICNVEAIDSIAKKYGLKVIYDAAHAFGEIYKGKAVGNFGDASIFSFHATKVFNTIEGGAATFQNDGMYEKLYNLKNFGIRGEEIVTEVGANAKMNEFAAIMGLCNLNYVEKEIGGRKEIYEKYRDLLSGIKGIEFFKENRDIVYNYAYCTILVKEEESGISRDALYNKFRENNIMVRKYFYPLTSREVCFGNNFFAYSTPIAEKMSNEVLILPCYSELGIADVERVCTIISNQ